jgi:plasmid stability protein
MPRKRSDEGKIVNATGQELRPVRLELPVDTHKLLRFEAARREMSMAAAARAIIEEFLAKQKGGSK